MYKIEHFKTWKAFRDFLSWLYLCGKVRGIILPSPSHTVTFKWWHKKERSFLKPLKLKERGIDPYFAIPIVLFMSLFHSWGQIFHSHPLHSCWRTSQMSWGPTSLCTWIKSFWSCRSLNQPAGGVCAPSPSSSRPPSALPESSSSARATPFRPSTSYAAAPWRCWRTTLC